MSGAEERTVQVLGMTCSHCVGFVSEELMAVPGVEAVTVDLAEGLVTIRSTHPIPGTEIGRAIEEAGYDLA